MNTDEALRRVRQIAPMLGDDVRTAVQTHAVLEAANDTIPRGVNHEFAATFNAIQNALALKLALELAGIFDLSKRPPPEEQDKASVPVLAALLGRPDAQLGLEREAESNWFPGVAHIGTIGPEGPSGETEAALRSLEENSGSDDRDSCRAAIAEFLGVVGRMVGPEGAALERLRQFRNQRLAHSLFDRAPDQPPKYADLFLLLGLAKDAARHASLAIQGQNRDFDDTSKIDRENADGYYGCVLEAPKRT
jgi:AbiU2